MITVNFYTNTSDRRVAAKVTTLLWSKSCLLKEETDILNPVLIVNGDVGDFDVCNYLEIPKFNRKYFITGVVALSGGRVAVTASVDILSSAIGYLQDRQAVIGRNENSFNLYLADGTFKTYANDSVITKEFSGGFSTPSYVLILSGG